MYYKLSMRQSFQKVRASRFLGDNSNFRQTFSEISLQCVATLPTQEKSYQCEDNYLKIIKTKNG